MLDNETKRKIDTARDILVGKVPDPKSQVEQITIALIYKFMDDMDLGAVELGGERSFFRGEFEKYAWRKIFDPRLGGYEILALYSEAIMKMNVNPNIPQLFRNIFKNAFLPYRDPETLKLFLKIINEFTYDHSERLGDAFEYLLSVLGSQGEAGQFRTPRHIIDFMVAIIDPKKDEIILDPACGTAGFLISAYKHIIKNSSSNYDPATDVRMFETKGMSLSEIVVNSKNYRGDLLTPDERNRLANNIRGYDISPDMVRLSLVNMYLHGLHAPHIYEYDTLTNEDRWNEYADVILANPPFMTPKGGIRPHKRFSITSNRSEVLFVDYIAEHLTPNGRAAVIVPEGIIFQSGKAYKNLRKMLVENYLVGVISLPAGIFNPYAGVKTSILWLDKVLAKKTDKILFVKIENDGFDLGAQRKPIKNNDLPNAFLQIDKYKKTLELQSDAKLYTNLQLVLKKDILSNLDCNLSGERYKVAEILNTKYPIVELGEIAEVSSGDSAPQDPLLFENGKYPFCRTSDLGKVHISNNLTDIADKLNDKGIEDLKLFPKGTILFPKSGASTFLNHRAILGIESYVSSHLATIISNKSIINHKFLFYLLCEVDAKKLTSEQNYPSLRLSQIKSIKIPLPPLSVQEEIVAEIESYQKIIDGARQVVENYKPRIDIDPSWPMVALGEIAEINKTTIYPSKLFKDWFRYIDISSVENGTGVVNFENIVKVSEAPLRARRVVQEGDILLSTVRPNLKAYAFMNKLPERVIASTGFAVISIKKNVNPRYIFYMLFDYSIQNQIIARMGKGSYPSINEKDVSELIFPVPPLEIQEKIVTQLKNEEEIILMNKELIKSYEQKIKDRIAKVWGE